MRKMCERPGCAGISELSYGIDHENLVVWIDNRALGVREQAGRLCRRHADALVVPRGWSIDDRRQEVPQLFPIIDRSPVEDDSTAGRARPKRRTEVAPPTPSLFEDSWPEDLRPEDSWEELTSAGDVADILQMSPDTTQKGGCTLEPVPETEPVPVATDPEETRAIPWSPRLHGADAFPEEEGERPVMGRLLGRAFKRVRDEDVS